MKDSSMHVYVCVCVGGGGAVRRRDTEWLYPLPG